MLGYMSSNSTDKGFNPSSALVKAVLINSAKPTATLLDSYGEPFPLSAVHTNVPDNCQVPTTLKLLATNQKLLTPFPALPRLTCRLLVICRAGAVLRPPTRCTCPT
jgi:hypothetical protein